MEKRQIILPLLAAALLGLWLVAGMTTNKIGKAQVVELRMVDAALGTVLGDEIERWYRILIETRREMIRIGDWRPADEMERNKWLRQGGEIAKRADRATEEIGSLLSKVQSNNKRLAMLMELEKRYPAPPGMTTSSVQDPIWRAAMKQHRLAEAGKQAALLGQQTAAKAKFLGRCWRFARGGAVNLAKFLAFIDPAYRDADERLFVALDTAYNIAHPREHSLVGKYLSSWLAKKLPPDVEPTLVYQLDVLAGLGTPPISEAIGWEEFKGLLLDLGKRGALPLKERREFWEELERDWYYITLQYPKPEMREWIIDYLNALRDDIKELESKK